MGTITINGLIERYDFAGIPITPRIANEVYKAYTTKLKYKEHSILEVFGETKSEYAKMTFKGSKTGIEFTFGIGANINSTEYLAAPPMVKIKRDKNVVVSNVENSEHEVIENFGLKPYEISFNGLLVDMEYHDYPWYKVQEINRLFSSKETYYVTSQLFNELGIDEIYFNDGFQVDFIEGFNDTVKYKFTAMQVQPLEFRILNK